MGAAELGRVLRETRAGSGRSLRSVAGAAGISPTYLGKLERGEVKSPSPTVLHALSESLSAPYADLMEVAGYGATRKTSPRRAASNVLASALGVDTLTEREVSALTRYLALFREEEARRLDEDV